MITNRAVSTAVSDLLLGVRLVQIATASATAKDVEILSCATKSLCCAARSAGLDPVSLAAYQSVTNSATWSCAWHPKTRPGATAASRRTPRARTPPERQYDPP